MSKNSHILYMLIIVILLINIPAKNVYCFFSSSQEQQMLLSSGSVKVELENLTLDGNQLSIKRGVADGVLPLLGSQTFSFTAKNSGLSVVSAVVELQLNWQEDLSESGKLFIYPSGLDDQEIYQQLSLGDTSGAAVGTAAEKEISCSTGTKIGIAQVVDTVVLAQNEFKSYEFKLFFYADSQINQNPSPFAGQIVEVGIKIHADIEGRSTSWAHTSTRFFNSITSIDIQDWSFIKIASGSYHSLVLTSHGRVYSWGRNVSGQLGDGTKISRSVPQLITSLQNIVDIAACDSTSFALDADGQLYAWGHDGFGTLGNDAAIADKALPVMVAQPSGVKFASVAADFNTAGAITTTGDVYTWGYGDYGAAGSTAFGETNPVPKKIALSNIAQLELGEYNGAAISSSGIVYTWGANWAGQLGNGKAMNSQIYNPEPITYFVSAGIKITSISVGGEFMTAASEDGRLFSWGYGGDGSLGNGSTSNKNSPTHVALPFLVVTVESGPTHSGLIDTDGNVYFFGSSEYGQYGTTSSPTPLLASGVSGAKGISLAVEASFVLDGVDVYAIGKGVYGQLGTGSMDNAEGFTKWAF